MTAAVLRDVQGWDALADLYGKVAHEPVAAGLVLEEARRRDRLERQQRERDAERGEWEDGAYAQYRAAEAATRGNMLSRRGIAAGIDEWSLWQGTEARRRAYASEELLNWLDDHGGCITVTAYRQQISDGHRIARDDRDAAATQELEPIQGETVTETPATWEAIAADRAPSALTREQRYAASLARARQDHADRVAQYRSAREPAPQPQAQVAVQAPAAFVRQSPDAVVLLRRVLDGIGLLLTDYVAFPSRSAAVGVVTWIAQAAARDSEGDLIWRAYVRLLVTSRRNGSGKSTLGDLVSMLLQCRAGRMSKVTPYGLTKVLGTLRETAIADDAQNVFRSDKAGAELLSILINGYTRGATWVSGKSDGKIEPAAGPVMIIGKDELITKRADSLRDLIDRSVVVRMERPDRYMPEVDEEAEGRARVLAEALKAVMGSLQPHLREAARELAHENKGHLITDGDGGRTAQIWRPMLAVARVAGGPWPEAVQQAMDELAAASGDLLTAEDALAGLERLDGSGDTGRSFWDEEG